MAVLTYDLVYRDGAASGSPVAKFKVIDLWSEMPLSGNLTGDLAYIKEYKSLYAWTGTQWDDVFNGGIINYDLTIQKDNSELALGVNGTPVKVRFFNFGGSGYLSCNLDYSGSAWVKDIPGAKGMVIGIQTDNIVFYGENGTSLITLGIMGYAGEFSFWQIRANDSIKEYGRTVPQGVWQNIPYSSSNFYADTGTWTVPSANILEHHYTLIGKTCTFCFSTNTTTVTNTSYIWIKTPNNWVANASFLGIGLCYDGTNWFPMTVEIAGGWNGFRLSKYRHISFPPTTGIVVQFQIQFEIM